MGLEMSLAETCRWTLARTVLLCLLAWPIIVAIERWLRELPDERRPLPFALLIAPFLFPELVVGYAFRQIALSSPQRAEWLCASLLFLRIVPVGVIMLLASPAALIGPAAIHCRKLLLRANPGSSDEWMRLVACYWHGPIRRVLPAMGLMGLVAFQEFELAALLQTASWTDWFVTAQRFGLDQNAMLRKAVWPLVLQVPLLFGAGVWLTIRNVSTGEHDETISKPLSQWLRLAIVGYLGCAILGGCLIPLGIMSWNLPSGLLLLVRQPVQWSGLGREIVIASSISIFAGLTTWFAGVAWSSGGRHGRLLNVFLQGLLLPGLTGSLLLSLVAMGLFQQTWLRLFYNTPIPWLLALIVWLLPRAVLLRFWLNAITRTEAVHLAEMLSQPGDGTYRSERNTTSETTIAVGQSVRPANLLFRLRDQPRLLGMGLLCYWAYLDLPTAYLLSRTGMDSGLVRLYNFMHFGRSAALTAQSLAFFGTPILTTFVVVQFVRFSSRR